MLEIIDGRGTTGPVVIPRPRLVGRDADAETSVRSILDEVRVRGDAALLELTRRFDRADLAAEQLRVDPAEIERSTRLVRPEVLAALEMMRSRVEATSARQMPQEWLDESDGVAVGELVRPLRSVGIYVPGGQAVYPSSVIMAAAPARVAGVPRISVATPPRASGEVPEAVLAACSVVGIDEVYRVGGAQAVAALAYGTETVRPVDKIVGPGNVFVTTAKRLVSGVVGTDAEAGPTELVIVADSTADPRILAADLVAQAEHGPHGAHVLITWDAAVAEATIAALDLEVLRHERSEEVENWLTEGGSAVLVDDASHALETANAFAPEHLQLSFEGAEQALPKVETAGAVFVGHWAPVAAGDYVAGTNHVLPSGGVGRWRSGLGAHEFVRRIYVCRLDRSGLESLAPGIQSLAAQEQLHAHSRSVAIRLDSEATP